MGLGAVIDASGISAPAYADILAALEASFRAIYGSDVVLDPDTADGQFLAIWASAINDSNQAAINAFNSFAPSFAQGVGLSNLVKINGIRRRTATKSTVDVTLTGQAGTVITAGRVQDQGGNLWDLPASVVIDVSGTLVATATCEEDGDITAGVGEVNIIATPTRGWQSVTNADPATPGVAVESDAALRRRQAASVALPAQTVLEAISAALGNVTGVSRYIVYENDTDAPDADGIPAHSISAVVEGGLAADVAEAVGRKPPGIQTYGTTSVTISDSRGVPRVIHFYNLTVVAVTMTVTLKALAGFVAPTGDKAAAAIAYYINALGIGDDVFRNDLFAPGKLMGDAAVAATGMTQADLDVLAETFRVVSIAITAPAVDGEGNAAIAFNAAAACDVADITIVVT